VWICNTLVRVISELLSFFPSMVLQETPTYLTVPPAFEDASIVHSCLVWALFVGAVWVLEPGKPKTLPGVVHGVGILVATLHDGLEAKDCP
jgi:hypothetical protein